MRLENTGHSWLANTFDNFYCERLESVPTARKVPQSRRTVPTGIRAPRPLPPRPGSNCATTIGERNEWGASKVVTTRRRGWRRCVVGASATSIDEM